MIRGLLLTMLWCILPLAASAQITITDIVYDPPGADTGREWVVVTNTSTSSIRLSDFKLRTSKVNHKITPLSGDGTLAPGERAAIIQDAVLFSADNASFTGALFRASFTLTNTSGTVEIADKKGAAVATKSYQAPPPAPKAVPQKSARPKAVKEAIQDEASDPIAPEEANQLEPKEKQVSAALTASAAPVSSWVQWMVGTGALAGFSSLALFAARRTAKEEWEIIEEKEGD